jgi:two-component system response regulator YesN
MLRVVLADDEPIILEGLRTLVDWNRLGFDICGEALDGEDALQLIRTYEPHLVVTDIRMPVIDGLQLIERAAALQVQSKFLILSGYGDFQYAKKAMQYGVANYLMKPPDEAELEHAVAALAADIRKEEERRRYEKSALLRIELETITRLLLGDGRQEWIEQAAIILRLHDRSLFRCMLIGFSPRFQPIREQERETVRRQI